MTTMREFPLPDVGEGLTEAEILRWLVHPGDVVAVNQMLVEIETAKAAVELPSPYAGTVVELMVEPGAIVPVGTPIVRIECADAVEEPQRQAVLVGYGVREQSAPTRRRRERRDVAAEHQPASTETGATVVKTKPPVRRLARELGVDLARLTPTGRNGEVTRDDVTAAAGSGAAPAASRPSVPPAADERVPLHGVHRAMAEAMAQSGRTIPHVTEWVDVDMTRAAAVVNRLRREWEDADVRVTAMTLVAAGLVRAARRFPEANATWVDEGPALDMHSAVNLGIAADTPRGLLVPVVKDAGSLTVLELARRIQQLIDGARAGKSSPADLTGGTISLTNIGVFGIDGGTPMLPPGQSVIVAMGRMVDRPWVVDGALMVRPIMQLSITFDHRVLDGATGSRVLKSVADFLDDPALELMVEREG